MLRAFFRGGQIVRLLVVCAGLLLLAYSAVDNALNFTKVSAVVEGVEQVCVEKGKPAATAVSCREANFDRKGMRSYQAVRVRYRSPADGQEHSGSIIPVGSKKAVEATRLKHGDRWTILA